MLCDECGRQEATIHIMQVGPEGRIERNLCEGCAANYGEKFYGSFQKKDMSINEFLQGVFCGVQPEKQVLKENGLVCPNCGMHYETFQKSGRIGCSECYAAFRQQLEPILRRVHGTNIHKGKIPHRFGGEMELQQEIAGLRVKLQEAVETERYEQAAEYRDRIRELERQARKEGRRNDG